MRGIGAPRAQGCTPEVLPNDQSCKVRGERRLLTLLRLHHHRVLARDTYHHTTSSREVREKDCVDITLFHANTADISNTCDCFQAIMDPLSLTASILGITSACLKSAHLLDGLREKYKHAQVTISALCAEATTISAFLSQIQSLVLANQGAIVTQLRSRTDIVTTFDTALTGCSIVVAVLNDEIATLVTEGSENDAGWRQKAMLAWKDNTMKDLLQQLRGQSSAIGLLIQALNA